MVSPLNPELWERIAAALANLLPPGAIAAKPNAYTPKRPSLLDRQRMLVADLQDAIRAIDDWTQPSAPSPECRAARPPTGDQLMQLSGAVFNLANTLRKKKPLGFSEAMILVNKRWGGIHLIVFFDRLFRRTRYMAPATPKRSVEVKHWLHIRRLATGDGAIASKAASFLKLHERLRRRKIEPCDADWRAYEEILRMQGETLIIPKSVARLPLNWEQERLTVRYLELEREWLSSQQREEQYQAAWLDLGLLEVWLELMIKTDDKADVRPAERNKTLARMRQQHRRAKIARLERVTAVEETISTLGPDFVGLRDLKHPERSSHS